MFPAVASGPKCFGLDTSKRYCADTTYFIPVSDFFLLGVLNSNCAALIIDNIADKVMNDYIRMKSSYVVQIPIPDAQPALRDQIAAIARQCLDTAKDAPERLPALEARLNQLVYQAYGLDTDDIAVIEGHLGGQRDILRTNDDPGDE